ncbi:MAG: FAD-dependent oxidoreductase, partial [Sphingomonadales bacterium]
MAEISLHKPLPAAEVAGWDFETDVAIIGFGATGACAAIEAADAGAQVMLFERNSGSGGASGLSGGEIYIGGGGGTDAPPLPELRSNNITCAPASAASIAAQAPV